MHRPNSQHRIFFFLVVLMTLVGLFLQPVNAQTPTPPPPTLQAAPLEQVSSTGLWSTPVNLSRSGAAAQPRLFASLDGQLQAFWLDRFDGLMTALYNGEAWSLPVQTTRPTSLFIVRPQKISVMPDLFSDSSNRIHAFWSGEVNQQTGEAGLFYNQTTIGSTSWSAPLAVTDSAPVFSALPKDGGGIQLTIIRTLKTESTQPNLQTIPPGIYSSSSSTDLRSWGPFAAVDTSIYYRIINPESSMIRVVVKESAVFLAWLEPHSNQVRTSQSTDGGVTWSPPAPFAPVGAEIAEPLLTILPSGQVLRIWQDASQSACVLYQQSLQVGVSQPAGSSATPVSPFRPTPTPVVTLGNWSEPRQVLSSLAACPTSSRFVENEGSLYWVWGEDTQTIFLSKWDAGREEWAQPFSISFGFEDPDLNQPVQLDNLRAAISGDRIAIIGADTPSGEIWSAMAQLSQINLSFAEPSPWSEPRVLSQPDQAASQSSVAVDSKSRSHIIWSQGNRQPGTSLYYARQEDQGAIQSEEIVRSLAGEIVRQPSLIIDRQDRLHLAWSGGKDGEIYYSRAQADQAGAASGWLPPSQVSGVGNASWPQIASSLDGRLYILYAVPLNEKRGIYLVYSENGGETWSSPSLIFDAQAESWEMVDHPSLTVATDGSLHAAWSRLKLAAASPQEGIWYSRTRGAFIPPATAVGPAATASPSSSSFDPQWTKALELAPKKSDWPHLAAIADQVHLVYWAEGLPNHRWVSLLDQTAEGVGWGTPNRLPNWEALETDSAVSQLLFESPPFALASDFQNLRVVIPIAGTTTLGLSEWFNSPTNARWSAPELFSSPGNWKNFPVLAASNPLKGGRLALTWLALPNVSAGATPMPSLSQTFFTVRQIGNVEVPAQPMTTPIVLPTPTTVITPTEVATATPQLSVSNETEQTGVSPLVLGSGLAALIVIAIFIGILVQAQKR